MASVEVTVRGGWQGDVAVTKDSYSSMRDNRIEEALKEAFTAVINAYGIEADLSFAALGDTPQRALEAVVAFVTAAPGSTRGVYEYKRGDITYDIRVDPRPA